MCVHWFVWRNFWKNCLSTTYIVTKSKVHHFREPLYSFLVRDWWGATENTGVTKRPLLNFDVWRLHSSPSGLRLITAPLVSGASLLHPSITSSHTEDEKEVAEADERRRRKCLRVRRLVAWTENRDFSYQLIETGSSPRDWIKEVHLVFICRRENFH